MLHVLRRMFRSEIAVNEWSVGNTIHCAERQKRIVMDVWPALKQNGILVYSTCTFNPGENEENIKWLIEKNEAECIRLDINDFDGLMKSIIKEFYGYGFYPGRIRGEGFFISAVKKTGKQGSVHIKSQKKTELKPERNDYEVADNWDYLFQRKTI